ncbi:MFS transporter [Rhizorhabdus dicambivorans]|uniref:MFS transporter n=1 Tax=Rhizorhabdus dicambivorans TaxID=1850238 RepID=A0A2A4FSM5_9SPHN|nr:MFS transporter [Rhizorhabdus dicambivorans]PCE40696.1 MFS transporter [Rhizorhabdus dicambivorans]
MVSVNSGTAYRPDMIASDATAPENPTGPLRRWFVVGLLSLIFAIGIVDRVILSMMIGPIKSDLQLSDSAFGLAQGAAVALFYLIFAVPFGWASDRFDHRWILFGGVTIWSLATAACALVRNFVDLFVARCLVGAGEAVIGPAGYPMIAGLVSRQQLALAMMLFYLGGNAGNALGQFIGGALLAVLSRNPSIDVWMLGDLAPWRLVFLLIGLPGIALAALIFIAPRSRAPRAGNDGPSQASKGEFAAFFRAHRRFYITHNVGVGLQQAALVATMLWNAAFMSRTYGWSPSEIGMTFGAILLASTSVAIVGHSWICARLFAAGQRDAYLRWQMCMSCLSVPALAFAYLWPTAAAACIGFALASLLNGGTVVAGPTILQIATPPRFRGRVSGIYVVVATLLGTAIGPAAVGLVTDHVLGDEGRIGIAIAICSITFCLGATACFATGLSATRRIVAEAGH